MWGGWALDELGRQREAKEWLGNAVRLSHGSVLTRLALGERDEALKWLRRVVEEKSHSRAFFGVDPQLASLRNDPRFVALLR
jgi:hypothetical protein